MNSFFNFLKSLFSSIFGIFGIGKKKSAAIADSASQSRKKSNGFFLELDNAKGAENTAANGANKAASTPASAPAKTPEPVAAAPAKAEAATTAQKKSSNRQAQLAAAAEKAEKAESAKPAPAAPKPAATNNGLNLPQPTVTTFAPNYLVPKATTSRRRPGANMTSYLDMARQVKTQG